MDPGTVRHRWNENVAGVLLLSPKRQCHRTERLLLIQNLNSVLSLFCSPRYTLQIAVSENKLTSIEDGGQTYLAINLTLNLTLTYDLDFQSPASYGYDLHACKKIAVKGQFCLRLKANVETDGRTDKTDCSALPANSVRSNQTWWNFICRMQEWSLQSMRKRYVIGWLTWSGLADRVAYTTSVTQWYRESWFRDVLLTSIVLRVVTLYAVSQKNKTPNSYP